MKFKKKKKVRPIHSTYTLSSLKSNNWNWIRAKMWFRKMPFSRLRRPMYMRIKHLRSKSTHITQCNAHTQTKVNETTISSGFIRLAKICFALIWFWVRGIATKLPKNFYFWNSVDRKSETTISNVCIAKRKLMSLSDCKLSAQKNLNWRFIFWWR